MDIIYYLISSFLAVALNKFCIEPLVLYIRDRHFYPYLSSVFLIIDDNLIRNAGLSFEELVVLAFKDAGLLLNEENKNQAIALVKRLFDVEKLKERELNDY